ncbi:helix-turn-helix domain-containing protein [Neorhizobium alkalisoli]|uniref:helix-turn-helix domain-containing protein n=1 Tax=Neorhizobium alkalisoli TaxID=528178 RepID=UPI000CF96B94|nr:helix-turn-helix domain-containing protein [Neorhizobium alkalisoli]
MDQKKPNPIDVYVGSRIRLRRTMLKMSQETLGENLGITFQQVQKYEKGTNRVGASRLQHISTILNVPVTFFFDDGPASHLSSDNRSDVTEDDAVTRFVGSREGIEFNLAFQHVGNPKLRQNILQLVKSLSRSPEAAEIQSEEPRVTG